MARSWGELYGEHIRILGSDTGKSERESLNKGDIKKRVELEIGFGFNQVYSTLLSPYPSPYPSPNPSPYPSHSIYLTALVC